MIDPGCAAGAYGRRHTLHLQTAAWVKAREVKVALSGLFGRFVARAYLERYFSLSLRSEPKTVVFVPIPWAYTNQPPAQDKTP